MHHAKTIILRIDIENIEHSMLRMYAHEKYPEFCLFYM